MKTLKISVAATIAMMLAWWLRLPHRFWPGHPYLADFAMALILSILLQWIWTDPKPNSKKQSP
jgi:hypothetical protein